MGPDLETVLKPLLEQSATMIDGWVAEGRIAPVDPRHLIFSIWATTQHYADFDAQLQVLMEGQDVLEGASAYLDTLYRRLLTP